MRVGRRKKGGEKERGGGRGERGEARVGGGRGEGRARGDVNMMQELRVT